MTRENHSYVVLTFNDACDSEIDAHVVRKLRATWDKSANSTSSTSRLAWLDGHIQGKHDFHVTREIMINVDSLQ